ncbi:MAG: hypothetical protein H7Z42_17730 [Roseiflexaceae bacterium]|nr:hypothetical protein [Roseiflexaceae bacterium]
MTTETATTTFYHPGQASGGPLYCALTGRALSADEAYWAAPLITTRALLSTILSTLRHAPGNLGYVLSSEQPNVPYAPEARELLAQRRSSEQAKLLFMMLLVAALLATPVLLLAMR